MKCVFLKVKLKYKNKVWRKQQKNIKQNALAKKIGVSS